MVRLALFLVVFIAGLSLGRPLAFGAANDSGFRPALIGNGPDSLVNLIDTQKLLEQGQGDAAIMFAEPVFGGPINGDFGSVYRGTPNSKPLQKEVLRALKKARFVPALVNRKPTPVFFHGTVLFFANSKPHLRVLANQDPTALAHFEDFIAPQLIMGTFKWDAKDPRMQAAARLNKNGAVTLQLQVSETGKLLSSKVMSEDPSGYNYGAVEIDAFSHAHFIPGFREGKPCACTFQMTRYVVIEHVLRWGGYLP
jgi:hypothetical protein